MMEQWVKKMSKDERAKSELEKAMRLKQEAESALEFAMLRARNPNDLRAQSFLRQTKARLALREQRLRDVQAKEG